MRKTEQGVTTYSFWYGQTYHNEEEAVGQDNLLGTQYDVSSVEDLEVLPERLSYNDIWGQFVRTFNEGSSVTVYKLTHYVVIFRRYVEDVGTPTRNVPLPISL